MIKLKMDSERFVRDNNFASVYSTFFNQQCGVLKDCEYEIGSFDGEDIILTTVNIQKTDLPQRTFVVYSEAKARLLDNTQSDICDKLIGLYLSLGKAYGSDGLVNFINEHNLPCATLLTFCQHPKLAEYISLVVEDQEGLSLLLSTYEVYGGVV